MCALDLRERELGNKKQFKTESESEEKIMQGGGAFDTLCIDVCMVIFQPHKTDQPDLAPRSYAKLAEIKDASSPSSPACNVLKKKTLEDEDGNSLFYLLS